MKILMLHNKYKIGGGEDIQTDEEFILLKKQGFDIQLFQVSNDSIDDDSNRLSLAINTIWSNKYYKILLEKIKTEKFDIIHVQNFFPLLSPSVLYAAKKSGAKVVMTVHNYRLVCPNALMYIENKICAACVGKSIPYPALFKKCYKDSFSATAVAVSMHSFHNLLKTWERKIDGLICISEFVKKQLILGGFKEDKLHIKFNFVSSTIPPKFEQGEYYIYVGRISVEKGIDLLLKTFESNKKRILIIGDGPLSEKVIESAKRNSTIEYSGKLPLDEVYKKIANAKALISASQSNEPFGRTIIEGFAHGTPVIGSSLGGITELIKDGINGFLFDPYKKFDLDNAINKFENVIDNVALRKAAFKSYEDNYTPVSNYNRILEIYNSI